MARPKTKQSKVGTRRSVLATRILERWGEAGGEMPLDRLISELGDVQRYDIVAALKELERGGAGEFLVGRAGRKARFVWSGGKAARAAVSDEAAAARKESEASARSSAIKGKVAKTAGSRGAVTSQSASAAKAASGRAELAAGSGATLEHVFHLRPGYLVTVRLPSDVARAEVERFCQFLQAIPFDARNS